MSCLLIARSMTEKMYIERKYAFSTLLMSSTVVKTPSLLFRMWKNKIMVVFLFITTKTPGLTTNGCIFLNHAYLLTDSVLYLCYVGFRLKIIPSVYTQSLLNFIAKVQHIKYQF